MGFVYDTFRIQLLQNKIYGFIAKAKCAHPSLVRIKLQTSKNIPVFIILKRYLYMYQNLFIDSYGWIFHFGW